MKKSIFGLSLLALSFVACKKDASFSDQVVGTWQTTNVKIGGTDVTASNTVRLTIEPSQEFDAEITTRPAIGSPSTTAYTGDWESDETKQEITLKYDNGETEKYDVTSITATSMKANVVVEGVRREFVFEKQQ
jgi:hypothetical protein